MWTLNEVVCFQMPLHSAAYTVGMNHLERTTSQYADAGFPQAHRESSGHIAMEYSQDSGYTISVKIEDQQLDLSNAETLQVIEPRRWTVDDHGVLVNADESEVAIKVEKPDWTTETDMADCGAIVDGQGYNETKCGILIVKEESSMCPDSLDMAVDHKSEK